MATLQKLAIPADSLAASSAMATARACQACPLWQPATQTVFGEGSDAAAPFVGPAGQLLDRAQLYLTNAVRHFKSTRSGKVRLHAKANPAGPGFELMRERGRMMRLPDGRQILATMHPSSVLRQPDNDEAYRSFVADLTVLTTAARCVP